jgi:ATP-dependent phosphofructokinase / diphosphate-dependent phosphofructokinase
MKPIRTIGIVDGGGDALGLNPVIRATVRAAINEHGMRVIGICNGFDGLIWPEGAKEMTEATVSGNTFAYKAWENGQEILYDYSSLCMDNARRLGIDAMIVIGGDSTQHLARDFCRIGVHTVGVPKTTDNDLDASEVTFGFDTALMIATEAIDRLHTAAESHHRVMLIEVMGCDAGWIALHSGIACGAHIILVPKIPFKFEIICDGVRARELRGKRFSLIVVAEGVKLPPTGATGKSIPPAAPGEVANTIGFTLRELLDKGIRVAALGHVQRGGSPLPFDRILGTRFGVAATGLVAKQQFGRMVCLKAGKMESVSLDEALEKMRYIDPNSEIVHAARAVGATFGDSA